MAHQDYSSTVFIGRLTADPDVRFTPGGKQVASFTAACNKRDGADFISVVAWEGLAKVVAENCEKGKQVLIQGRLTSRKWEKDGHKHTAWEVVARDIQLLNGRHVAASDAPEGSFADKGKQEFDAEEIGVEELPF